MPRFKCFKWTFLISSSRISDNPTSLIILLARFIFYTLVLLIKFFMACIPYSDIELSAKFSSENLHFIIGTGCFQGCLLISWLNWHLVLLNSGSEYEGTFLSSICLSFPWTCWLFRGQASILYLGIAKRIFLRWGNEYKHGTPLRK